MSELHPYPKLISLHKNETNKIFDYEVDVEEKIDGSQFSFGVIQGKLYAKSKGTALNVVTQGGMFANAVSAVKRLAPNLVDGAIYRAECVDKPKHNVITYSRVPKNHFVLFDINVIKNDALVFLTREEKEREAARLGLEITPLLHTGRITLEDIAKLNQTESMLGGAKIEGVVLKNPQCTDKHGNIMFVKAVNDDFKEKMTGKLSSEAKNIFQLIASQYKTEARWLKAIQALAELESLTDTMKDVGPIIGAVHKDIMLEEEAELKDMLFNAYKKQILNSLTDGLPEWYRNKLSMTDESQPLYGDDIS